MFSQKIPNIKVSASNLFRYGKGNEITTSLEDTKEYFEELGDIRLYVNDLLFAVRYEYDDPIEFGTSLKGITRRYVEYRKDDFTVRAGNFYELFERGLTLNAFENRGLGFNTQMDGVKLNFKRSIDKVKLNATVLGGGLQYNDYLRPDRVENYSIRAANFDVTPYSIVTLGGSYLFTTGQIPTSGAITNITAEIFEGNLGFNYKSINMFASYANKKTITQPNSVYPQSIGPRGDGAYGTISFTRPGFGVTFDYKNYRFNLVVPNEVSSTSPTKALPFQQPPTCIREYSSTLLTRNTHIVDFNDELGFQTEAFYSPKENLTFNLNLSLSSRHYDYVDIDTTVRTLYRRVSRSVDFLPSPEDKFSPYWEIYAEAEYYYKKNLKLKIAFGRQSSVLYSNTDPTASDKERATTIPVEITYDFKKVYSLKLIAEQQWSYKSLRASGQNNFYNEYISLSVSRSPDIILNGNLELSNDKEDPSRYNPNGKIVAWASGEVTYKISSANSVTLSYGSERGGLKCSSGICRYVNPFKGFRLTVINNF
ncbi:MAG: DUF6029 family protein [Ignavibacteria bacterium]